MSEEENTDFFKAIDSFGLENVALDGQWNGNKWITSDGIELTYMKWGSNQPNYLEGENFENFLETWDKEDQENTWNNQRSNHQVPVVCLKEISAAGKIFLYLSRHFCYLFFCFEIF